ncbi:hypothetical protein [Streptomyces sp. NPDC048057]|uniref:hypothetical protein n=1 Tax=Streptomyces sp. NPDC048057 TaxID=3155628 RepID=UPI0033F9B7F9
MTERKERAEQEEPLPRDPQNQQATDDDEDPWAVDEPARRPEDDELPDTDEAGSGPEGGRRTATVHPEHPTPDEPTG